MTIGLAQRCRPADCTPEVRSMLISKTLFAQLLVVALRPAVFIWSVSVLSAAGWTGGYLVALGLIPIFATLDMLFQSVARHRHIRGFAVFEVLWWGRGWVLASALVLIIAVGFGVTVRSAEILSAVLVCIFVVAACFNLFEARISSQDAVFDQAVFELVGFGACAILALAGHQLFAAVLVNTVFPIARLSTVCRHRRTAPNVRNDGADTGRGSVYVGSAMAAQFLASVAASSPAVMVSLAMMDEARLAVALIYFKVLFAVSSLFSVVVNLFGSRIFYGHIHLDMSSRAGMLRVAERVFLVLLGVMGLLSFGVLTFGGDALRSAAVAATLCVMFAYLNTMSSLALARGRPVVSAAAQSVVLVGAVAFALMLGGSRFASAAILVGLVCSFTLLLTQARVVRFLHG